MNITDEERFAILCLAREYDLDRRHIGNFMELFIQSLGRAFIKDWRRLDAVDPEIMQTPDGPVATTGWQYGATPDQALGNKWRWRVRLWTDGRHDDLRHVLDWLSVAALEVQPWTQVSDDNGNIPRLHKSTEHLIGSANKFHQRRLRAAVREPLRLTEGDEQVEIDLADGYQLVRLLTPNALVVEGILMHHCIGQGGYARKLGHELMRYYSVRDPSGDPVATLEVTQNGDRMVPWIPSSDRLTPDFRGRIEQLQGPRNGPPNPLVIAVVEAAFPMLGWEFRAVIQRKMIGDAHDRMVQTMTGEPSPRLP